MIILKTTINTHAKNEINSILNTNNEATLSKKGGYNEIVSNIGYQLSFMGNQALDDSQTKNQITITEDFKEKILEKTSGLIKIVVA